MINIHSSLHGGCGAYLVDLCVPSMIDRWYSLSDLKLALGTVAQAWLCNYIEGFEVIGMVWFRPPSTLFITRPHHCEYRRLCDHHPYVC